MGASLHAPILGNRVFPHLAHLFGDIEQAFAGRTAIVGGDLNTARLAEQAWPNYGHGPFFDRIDRGESPFVIRCRVMPQYPPPPYAGKELVSSVCERA